MITNNVCVLCFSGSLKFKTVGHKSVNVHFLDFHFVFWYKNSGFILQNSLELDSK